MFVTKALLGSVVALQGDLAAAQPDNAPAAVLVGVALQDQDTVDAIGGAFKGANNFLSFLNDPESKAEPQDPVAAIFFFVIIVLILYCCCCKKGGKEEDDSSSDEDARANMVATPKCVETQTYGQHQQYQQVMPPAPAMGQHNAAPAAPYGGANYGASPYAVPQPATTAAPYGTAANPYSPTTPYTPTTAAVPNPYA